jgi:dTMP kinase
VPEHQNRGILIAIEGIEGAGKTTQVKKLSQSIKHAKPTNDFIEGAYYRSLGKHPSPVRVSGRLSLDEELQTFIKDRTEHVEKLIRPRLDTGETGRERYSFR